MFTFSILSKWFCVFLLIISVTSLIRHRITVPNYVLIDIFYGYILRINMDSLNLYNV